MKLYFTKYLPVEGKIEMGDKFIDTGVMNLIGTRTNKEGEYDFQKVKLFLCSRDIQVGDLAKDLNVPLTDFYVDDKVLKDIKSGIHEMYTKMDLYKVIGPVSEAALSFVKEGQEFDREDIRIFKTCSSYNSKLITEIMGGKWEHKEDHIITPGKVKYIKIKNVDGKFY